MKKTNKGKVIVVMVLCMLVLGVSVGCQNDKIEYIPTVPVEDQSGSDQVANPWLEQETLEDAKKATGFAIEVPDPLSGYSDMSIQTLEKEMIQVIYQGKTEENCVTIRKGTGNEDISGNYNEYSQENQKKIGDFQVTEKGNGGKIMLATWTSGAYAYSVDCNLGMSEKEIETIIRFVK